MIKTLALIAALLFGQHHAARQAKDEVMADAVWISNDGDGQAITSYITGAVPGGTDNLVMNGTSQVAMTTGLTFSANPTFQITKANKANVGFAGNGVITSGSNVGKHRIMGDGDVYINRAIAWFQAIVDMGLGRAVFGDGGDGWICPQLIIKGGRVDLGDKATAHAGSGVGSYLYVYGSTAIVNIAQHATPTIWETILLQQGLINNARDFEASTNRVIVTGGDLNQTGVFKGAMWVYILGGYVRYAPVTDPTGEGAHYFIDGTLDVRDSNFAIPTGNVIIGRNGEILGSAIDDASSYFDVDLRQELP